MARRKRSRRLELRIIENLPREVILKNLRALIDFREQNKNSLFKVDLALAIIKYHRSIDVRELCNEIGKTNNYKAILRKYLDREFKRYGLSLDVFYVRDSNVCPYFEKNNRPFRCDKLNLIDTATREAIAIKNAISALAASERIVSFNQVSYADFVTSCQTDSCSYSSITTTVKWKKMISDAEEGRTCSYVKI